MIAEASKLNRKFNCRKTALLSSLAVAAFSVLAVSTSQAIPITYTFSATGSGSLGGHNFSGIVFTITASADLNLSPVTQMGAGTYVIACSSASVYVTGIGTGFFTTGTTPIDVVLNQSTGRVGISSVNQGLPILFDINSQFAAYNLASDLSAPIAGTAAYNSGTKFTTTDGTFSLTSVSGVTYISTISQASVSVPDNSPTIGTLLISVLALGGMMKILDSKKRFA